MNILTVDCKPMRAKLTEHGCKTNQKVAKRGYDKLMKSSANRLSDIEVHRLFCCGDCPLSCADINLAKARKQCDYELKVLEKRVAENLETNPINVFEFPAETYAVQIPTNERGEE